MLIRALRRFSAWNEMLRLKGLGDIFKALPGAARASVSVSEAAPS